jgi:ribonuclease R/exosome complex exonuclease DIS3/RRP44
MDKIKIGNLYEGEIRFNKSGSAYLVNDELPKDIYINKKNTGRSLHLDTVEVEIIKGGQNREIEGRVIEVVNRFKTKFVGTMEVTDRFAFLIPDSPKMNVDVFVPLSKLNGAKDGEKVIVKLTRWRSEAKNPNGEVIEVLGKAGDNDVEIHSILHEYNLPYNFPEEVEDESNKINLSIASSEIKNRKDLRDVLTFTIDPDTAKDFDDALSYEELDNGNISVGIHIADVSHYVRPGTELDKEAYKRGTSIYLVDRVVPMLPERLSNGVCSLRPHEDKLCFSAMFELTPEGNVVNKWFGRTVIHSDRRYTYEEAQSIIEAGTSVVFKKRSVGPSTTINYEQLCASAIIKLDEVAKKMRKKRGSVTFDKQEIKFKLDENNKPVDLIFKVSKDSNKLIEEYMLLANKEVAKLLNSKGVAIPNRIHDEPDPTKLQELKTFVSKFDYKIDVTNSETIKNSLNDLLSKVKGTSEENLISNLVVRTMQKAEYSTDNIGHYGLGFEDYAHFTSPIRRYPDVILHRTLNRVLEGKATQKKNKLEAKCQYLSKCELTAQKASRDSIKFKQAEYMADRVGKVYNGLVMGVTNYGLFVEITDTNCEGLVRLNEIGGDTFTADMDNYCVKGYNTGEVIRLGDEVTIVVKSVDLEKKNIDLTLIRL